MCGPRQSNLDLPLLECACRVGSQIVDGMKKIAVGTKSCQSSTWISTTAISITSCHELRVAYLTKKPRRFYEICSETISHSGNSTRRLTEWLYWLSLIPEQKRILNASFTFLRCKEPNMRTSEPDCYRSLRNKKGARWRTWSTSRRVSSV